MRAPRRSLRASRAPMPTASTPATTRCRRSPGSARMRWRRPSSSSPRPCSPTPATCRPAASPIAASANNNIELAQQPPDTAEVLTKIADAADAGKALEEFSPPHEAYKALKAKLAELRGTTAEEEKVVRIADGPMLRPGMDDPRVPAAAQASQCRRRRQQPALRGRAGRRGEGVPEGRRLDRRRHARRRHRASAQRPRGAAPQRRRRPRHRQHGALALVSARSRQGLCRSSTSRTSRSR